MHVHIDIPSCPKCRNVWSPSIVYQELTRSGKFVIQFLSCDCCEFVKKVTVHKGQEDIDVPVYTYRCNEKRRYSQVESDSSA